MNAGQLRVKSCTEMLVTDGRPLCLFIIVYITFLYEHMLFSDLITSSEPDIVSERKVKRELLRPRDHKVDTTS